MISLHLLARWSLVLAVAVIVQIGLVTQMSLLGVVPDIMVVLAICAGLTGGPQRGAVIGFWSGLLFDLPRPVPLGLSALAYCLVAFAAGTVQVVVLQSGRVISVIIVAVASALGIVAFAVAGEFFGEATLENPKLGAIVATAALVGGATSRIGLRVAGWADGPETRSVAE